jgi:hypothetical protein
VRNRALFVVAVAVVVVVAAVAVGVFEDDAYCMSVVVVSGSVLYKKIEVEVDYFEKNKLLAEIVCMRV